MLTNNFVSFEQPGPGLALFAYFSSLKKGAFMSLKSHLIWRCEGTTRTNFSDYRFLFSLLTGQRKTYKGKYEHSAEQEKNMLSDQSAL